MIAETIKQRRKALGITQGELASRLGVRQATISDFERGIMSIRSETLEKIMEILELEIKESNGLV